MGLVLGFSDPQRNPDICGEDGRVCGNLSGQGGDGYSRPPPPMTAHAACRFTVVRRLRIQRGAGAVDDAPQCHLPE